MLPSVTTMVADAVIDSICKDFKSGECMVLDAIAQENNFYHFSRAKCVFLPEGNVQIFVGSDSEEDLQVVIRMIIYDAAILDSVVAAIIGQPCTLRVISDLTDTQFALNAEEDSKEGVLATKLHSTFGDQLYKLFDDRLHFHPISRISTSEKGEFSITSGRKWDYKFSGTQVFAGVDMSTRHLVVHIWMVKFDKAAIRYARDTLRGRNYKLFVNTPSGSRQISL